MQSGNNVSGTDFVVIRNTDLTRGDWSIEGVVVETDGPVAIRVEIHGKSEHPATNSRDHGFEFKHPDSEGAATGDNKWVPVANGALLWPCKTRDIQFNNYQEQLILFPIAYFGSLHAARITFVECSGAPVRVGLLVSNTRTCNFVCGARDTPESESVFARRSESFESPRDYREWW